ncbi:MAG TPA: hypothetical protein VM536_03750, partial [Chloroflexia bacterium]|nr:hypothetical protein [Chloroflexia bacterium]
MNKSRMSMLLVSLGVSASMLLTACGADTPTNTPVANTPAPTAATGTTPAVAPTTGGTASGGVVKIAVALPIGGAEGANGIPTRQGIQLAIDQANRAGGVTLDGKQYQIQMYFLDDVPPGEQAHTPA